MKKFIVIAISLIFALNLSAQTLQDAQREIDNENYFNAKKILYKLLKDGTALKNDVYYYLGNAYLKTEDPDSAKIFYKMVFNPDTKTPIGYLANSRLALLSKNSTDAKTNFDRALQLTKMKNASIYYEIGDAYFRPNIIDLNAAIANFTAAYDLDNKNVTVMLALGDAYLANSANDNTMGGKAMNKYQAAEDIDPKRPITHIKIGRLSVNGRIYDQAIDEFKKALEIDQNYPVIYKELANAYFLTKHFDLFKTNMQKYVGLMPGDNQAKMSIINIYLQNKEWEAALDEANKALKNDPTNYIIQRVIFICNYELQRYQAADEARKNFWNNPKKKVKDIDIVYSARIAAQVGDTAEAIRLFQQAIASDSSNCDMLGEFGKVLLISKRYAEAISMYTLKKNRCGKLTSTEIFYLGKTYLSAGDSVAADSAFTEFIIRNPTSPDGYYQRAKVRQRFGKVDDFLALPDYLKFIEIAEASATKYKNQLIQAYAYVGSSYFEKDKAKAKEYFQKALKLDPEDKDIIDAMKLFK